MVGDPQKSHCLVVLDETLSSFNNILHLPYSPFPLPPPPSPPLPSHSLIIKKVLGAIEAMAFIMKFLSEVKFSFGMVTR